jgi:putative heme-binding domain-containing protein
LVEYAESTPAENRTSDAFVDAMQLADGLLAAIPVADAKAYRGRLREVTVRVVRIRTIEEEMRYDTPYFAVEAGRPVQVILENDDLMPHNLVVTVPGALKEVAKEGLAVGPRGGWQGKQYVPDSDQVLFATDAVQPHGQYRLTFDAPSEPGEYPYVCTFPQHWYRMHGVMVVVDDLDAWLQDPTEPADPIGSNRSFIQAWTVDDFEGQLESGLRGRTPEIGKQLFAEASCAGCHRVGGEGGKIGPELTKVFSRWKGDPRAVLREILEPSHRIDDKYAMHLVLTVDGQTVSGIVTDETRDAVTLVASPEAEEPTIIARDDIEEMVKTSQSMMPKSLLDQYTRDEILEILAYLKSVDPQVDAQ